MAYNSSSTPVSEVLRSKDEDVEDDEPKTKSREDWRKAKELEEARKAGTAPAAVDEEGRDINPHIPQYIASAPWYYGSRGPTLKHQRIQPEQKKSFSKPEEWYKRGVDTARVATKFRKGACENCGAMTHKKKDCVERPRKVGAKFSGDAIAPDEHLQPKLDLGFDGKRDRWNGYDSNEYLAVVDDFQKVEEAKRQLKTEKLKTGQELGDLPDNMVLDDDVPEEDEDKYVDDVDMPGTKVDSKQRITVRNLRIREDIAKYLRNLDPNSAYYDPKTRSMRDNPYKDINKNPDDYAGENFVRFSGDTLKHATAQVFAWDAHDKGVDVHVLAEPTKLEMLQKEFEKKKDEFKGSLTKNVIDKYGGEEHLKAPPKTLLLAQSESYVEYSRQGKVIKGNEKPVIRSKYEEDVFPNNHTLVFGSYWRAGQWGYKCCHSLIRNSYCTGEAGKQSNDSVEVVPTVSMDDEENSQSDSKQAPESSCAVDASAGAHQTEELPGTSEPVKTKSKSKNKKKNEKRKERKKKKATKRSSKRRSSSSSSSASSSSSSSESDSEDEEEKKKKRLAKALRKEEERQQNADTLMDDRKRAYHSLYDVAAPTEEELEAYYMRRSREEDPMLQFLSKKPKKH
ncbi:Pre-mRNA-splicing factor SLU7 [Orchesella cincta]|uniref:Pre-mRNA-splicing factor SLU7 n=1 Tax=Orchesella cincta TaxID=48709 RepID=A0A1D2N283_ORCCI|nr:Pre-mRNA-splicing factor SLU7 [Orchesella cincta]